MLKEKLRLKLNQRVETLNALIDEMESDLDLALGEEELVLESVLHQLKLCTRMCANLCKR